MKTPAGGLKDLKLIKWVDDLHTSTATGVWRLVMTWGCCCAATALTHLNDIVHKL
jgi:hypothetical protein